MSRFREMTGPVAAALGVDDRELRAMLEARRADARTIAQVAVLGAARLVLDLLARAAEQDPGAPVGSLAEGVRAAASGRLGSGSQRIRMDAHGVAWTEFNQGRLEGLQRPRRRVVPGAERARLDAVPEEEAEAEELIEFVAVMDNRTTATCRSCHGVKLPASDPWWASHTPPLHEMCRSVLRPAAADAARQHPPQQIDQDCGGQAIARPDAPTLRESPGGSATSQQGPVSPHPAASPPRHPPYLATDPKRGLTGSDRTPQSDHDGRTGCHEHPEFEQLRDDLRRRGFELVPNDTLTANAEMVEVLYDDGRREVVRRVNYDPKMRYLDLLHEVGHVDQLERMNAPPPYTERLRVRRDGQVTPHGDKTGVLSERADLVLEYHNRLVELRRLIERNAPAEVIAEHEEGCRSWQREVREQTDHGNGYKVRYRTLRAFTEYDELDRWFTERPGGTHPGRSNP